MKGPRCRREVREGRKGTPWCVFRALLGRGASVDRAGHALGGRRDLVSGGEERFEGGDAPVRPAVGGA